MRHPVDDLVAEAHVAAAFPQDVNVPDIKVGAADATFGSTSFTKPEAVFTREPPPLLKRLLTFAPRAALAASVSGFAWVTGSYFFGGQSPFYAMKPQPSPTVTAQESAERAELLHMKQKITEDIRALQARVEAMPAARSLKARDATSVEDLKRRLDAMKRETGAAIADLAGKIEQMQRETTAKLSQVSDQRNQTERQIAPPPAASSRAAASELAVGTIPKQTRKRRDDAFDPSQYPDAPGAPRPLKIPGYDRAH